MSCSAMETHAMKHPAYSFCAEVNPRGDLVCVSQTGLPLCIVNCELWNMQGSVFKPMCSEK